MTSAGSSGGLPPSNVPKTTTSETTAQNTQQNQNTPNSPQARRSGGPQPADKNTPIMSDKAANAAYAQVAGQIKNLPPVLQSIAGAKLTMPDGTVHVVDVSSINPSTVKGLQKMSPEELKAIEEDNDGQDLTDADKTLLAAAFGMFHAV